jgi:lipopolysaccharide/colanic/teichoic acid biosynthesis glycosyltransferase
MNNRRLEIWILLADLVWILLAYWGADLLRYGTTWDPDERIGIHALVPFVAATCLTWIALSIFMQLDGFRGGWRLSAALSHLFIGICFIVGVLAVIGYFSRTYVSRLALTFFIALLAAGFVGLRCATRSLLRLRYDEGHVWRVLILGSGRIAREVASKIEQHPEMLCKVVGLLFPTQTSDWIGGSRLNAVSSQLSTLDIFGLLRSSRVNEIVVALPQLLTPEIHTLINRARDMGIETSVVPQSYELYAFRPKFLSLDGLPLLKLREPGLRRRYVVLKRALDIAVSMALLLPAFVLLSPVVIFFLLKKRTAFRWETRCGQYGVSFRMLRLNVQRPVANGSRFERLLERFSITELPQLWNVFRGQMSLVGPRPESPALCSQYSEWQQRRLRVMPGMTGLAQVHGQREFSSVEQKTRFDLQYVMAPYLLWDISLLLQTVWTLVRRLVVAPRARDRFDLDWKFKRDPAAGALPHAHRPQPSTD